MDMEWKHLRMAMFIEVITLTESLTVTDSIFGLAELIIKVSF